MLAPCVNREEEEQQPPVEGCEEYERKSGKGLEGGEEERSAKNMDGAGEQWLEVEQVWET